MPIDYDPLLAKLIGYGSDRQQAISRLERALHEYFVGGIKTNLSLFRRILSDADFKAGRFDTGYLDRLLKSPAPKGQQEDSDVAAIAAGSVRDAGTRSEHAKWRRIAESGAGEAQRGRKR